MRRGDAIAAVVVGGLVMVLEMLNTRTNHPGQFFTHTGQGYMIARAVNSPSCKLLYDMYHQQITEGNLIPNIDAAWSELSIAKADGFSGTVSYTKALGLITSARTMQTVENFDACYNQAKDARFYIRESRKGQ